MLRKNVIVERPKGTKIYNQRNCQYVYHVTGKEYKKANDNFYTYYEIVGGEDDKLPRFSDAVQIGTPLLLTSIMDELKVTELLEMIHGTENMNLTRRFSEC